MTCSWKQDRVRLPPGDRHPRTPTITDDEASRRRTAGQLRPSGFSVSGDWWFVTDRSNDDFRAPSRTLTLDEELGITFALFRERALQTGAFHSRTVEWPTDVRTMPDLGEPLASGRNNRMQTHVVIRGDCVCHVRITQRWVEVSLAARSLDAVNEAERDLRTRLPPPEPTDSATSSLIRFWYRGHYSGESTCRRIAVPEWLTIRANYCRETVKELESLMGDWAPTSTGRLLLWHGSTRHRQDIRAARARPKLAPMVRTALHRRPGGVLWTASGLHCSRCSSTSPTPPRGPRGAGVELA